MNSLRARSHAPAAAQRHWPVLVLLIVAAMLLAACGPTAATITSAAPTVEPVATTPATTPTPSQVPKAQTLAIEALVAEIVGGKLTYRISFKGHVSASVDTLPIAGSMDVSGSDFASSFTYDFTREYDGIGKYRVQVRAVRGKGYIKRASEAWTTLKSYDAADSYVPFKAVKGVADVRYIGPVVIDGKTFHKVSIAGAVLIHPNTIPYQIQKEKIDDLTLELVIDDAGRPLSGSWNLRGQARVGPSVGQLQRVVYDLDLTFSKVGAKLTIERP